MAVQRGNTTINTTATEVFNAGTSPYQNLILQNLGANPISIALNGEAPFLSQGIVLVAGERIVLNQTNVFHGQTVNAISATAASELAWQRS